MTALQPVSPMAFSRALVSYRIARGLSRQALAAELDISVSRVIAWETCMGNPGARSALLLVNRGIPVPPIDPRGGGGRPPSLRGRVLRAVQAADHDTLSAVAAVLNIETQPALPMPVPERSLILFAPDPQEVSAS